MNKIAKILTHSVMAIAIVLGLGSCKDDYFDVNGETAGGNSTESLWQIIQKTSELSDFAKVCEKAKFYTNEKKPSTGYTFKDLLSGDALLTVYAPINGSYDVDEMLKLAETDGYKLQNTFLGNHIVRFRHDVVGTGTQKLMSLNGKWSVVNNQERTYVGVNIVAANASARNGVLHQIKQPAEFNYNLYEFLRDPQGFDKFSEYFMRGDTAMFSAYASVEGDVIEGQIHYLDSVFYNSNRFFYGWRETSWKYSLPGMFADLSSEDSTFVMIIPSDAAYEPAINKFKSWLTYAKSYPNSTARSSIESSKDANAKATFEVSNPDSLRDVMAPAYLMRSLVFNVNAQKGGSNVWNLDNFMSKVQSMTGTDEYDYLVNTHSDTLHCLPYKQYMHGDNDIICSDYADGRTWHVKDMFDGQQGKKMSNGLAYVVNNLNFDFNRTFKSDIRIEAEHMPLYQPKTDDGINAISVARPNDSIQSKYGKVSEDYLLMYKKSTGRNTFQYALSRNILAGKYDIFVVTVPYVVYDDEAEYSYEFKVDLNYVDADGKEAKISSETFTTAPDKCDTVLVFSDFKFPVAYLGLEDAYPVLSFNVSSKTTAKKNHNNMCIDFIYLKSKED